MKKLLTFCCCTDDRAGLGACGKQDATVVWPQRGHPLVFYARPSMWPWILLVAEGLQVEFTNGGGADKVMTAVVSGQSGYRPGGAWRPASMCITRAKARPHPDHRPVDQTGRLVPGGPHRESLLLGDLWGKASSAAARAAYRR